MKKKVMAVLVLLLLIACAEEAPRPKPGPIIPEIEITKPQAQPLPQRPEYEPPPTYPFETGKLVEIAMIAKDFKFTPNAINVAMGDRVRLTITSVDMTHTFTLPIFGIDKSIQAGQTATIEFLADQKGQFTFYCNVPGHASKGMTGRINVT